MDISLAYYIDKYYEEKVSKDCQEKQTTVKYGQKNEVFAMLK